MNFQNNVISRIHISENQEIENKCRQFFKFIFVLFNKILFNIRNSKSSLFGKCLNLKKKLNENSFKHKKKNNVKN